MDPLLTFDPVEIFLPLILGLVGIYFVFAYLISAIDSWLTDKFEAYPRVRPLISKEAAAPRKIIDYHEKVRIQMEGCGFEPVAQVMHPLVMVDGLWIAISLYLHPDLNETAIACSCFLGMGDGAKVLTTARHIQFNAEFQDGSLEQIETTNFSLPSMFPRPPSEFFSQLPHAVEADELYIYHRAIVELLAAEQRPVSSLKSRDSDAAVRYILAKTGVESYERGFEQGDLRKCQSGKFYRPTLIQAFKMSWTYSFPVRQILQASIRANGKRIAEGLNAGSIS